MRTIGGTSLLLAVLTLTPAVAWSQLPLTHTAGTGAGTDISGGLYDGGVSYVDENGNTVQACPPTQVYGQNSGYSLPPRQTGGDGLATTADAHSLDGAGRRELTMASADATRGRVQILATADTSIPCLYGNFMSASGVAVTQFYDTYTVTSAPSGSTFSLQWSLRGSFSTVRNDTGGGGLTRRALTRPPRSASTRPGRLMSSPPSLTLRTGRSSPATRSSSGRGSSERCAPAAHPTAAA